MSHQDIGENLCFFNDVIDGYFPLQISLSHLLKRLDTSLAYLEIKYGTDKNERGIQHGKYSS